MKSARRHTVLGAIRHHLREAHDRGPMPVDRAELPAAPATSILEDLEARVQRFVERLGVVGAKAWRVGDVRGAAAAIGEILEEQGARKVAFSDEPLCAAVRGELGDAVEPVDAGDRVALFDAEAGVTSAQHLIAESGTLVLESSVERHRLVSLLPPLHIAVVPVSRLVGTIAEALGAVHAAGLSPSVTFVTGPSRTADIELTLVVGVHGPKHLHVVLVDNA